MCYSCVEYLLSVVFLFKQKTAYEMRISDWSSDVCSSDLVRRDGIALYQTVDDELHEPKPKTPESALAMAEEYFEDWFPGAMQKYEGAKFHIEKRHLKPAAFEIGRAHV